MSRSAGDCASSMTSGGGPIGSGDRPGPLTTDPFPTLRPVGERLACQAARAADQVSSVSLAA
eukprot:113486-Alexandrium_andersonii.AAC.1